MRQHASKSSAYSGLAALVAVALITAGCGGEANPMAPSIPVPSSHATFGTSAISGQLVDGGGSSASASLGATPRPAATSGIQVSIDGTSAATQTDGGGRFLLAGVPDGNVTLKITGGGNNSSVMVQGVGANQLVQLTIQVQPGAATVLQERRDALEGFEGLVVLLDPAVRGFTLDDGTTLVTDDNTWWDTGGDLRSYAELQTAHDNGSAVRVEGRLAPTVSGPPLATVVKAEVDDLNVEDLRLRFSRDKWSLGWIGNGGSGNGNSAIEARISGGPFAEILSSSVEMQGPDDTVAPFATELESGERFIAKFTKAQAISVAVSVAAGDTVEIIVRGTLTDGTPWELTAPVEITDDDDGGEDDDDDGNGNLDPAIAAQAIAQIQVVIDYINELVVAGDMQSNNAQPLITKLQSAIGSLEKLNGNPSINKLEAFLNQLSSSKRTGKIPAEDADLIEGLVEDIIDLLEGSS